MLPYPPYRRAFAFVIVVVVVVVVAYITHPTRNGRAAFGNPHNV